METKILYNLNMHFEHELWNRELDFWEDELKSFNNRLSELVTRWTNKEVLEKLEHFQSEFIIHGGVIEDVLEAIDKHELGISNKGINGDDSLETRLSIKHMEIREKMENQRNVYAELKKDFFKFLVETM